MEEKMSNSESWGKFVLPAVIAALIVFAAIGFYLYQSNNTDNTANTTSGVIEQPEAPVASSIVEAESVYNDGTYSVTGNYISPGGPREVKVTITLADDVITTAQAEGTATDATSKRFQGEFVENFKPQVIGKNIDEVNLIKVAGSSLTPKGFNDAIEKAKVQAKS